MLYRVVQYDDISCISRLSKETSELFALFALRGRWKVADLREDLVTETMLKRLDSDP
jgi:hypothetical protein